VVPAAVAFVELLFRDRLFAVGMVRVGLGKHPIDGMHDASFCVAAAAFGALGDPDKVVHKDVDVRDRSVELEEGGPGGGWRTRRGQGQVRW
jgi:hypothetical protein